LLLTILKSKPSDWRKYWSFKKDIGNLIASLEDHPEQGTALGKNCYKIRLSIVAKVKGKRGGARVITYVKISQETVFLLAVYDKSEVDSLIGVELERRLSKFDLSSK
jgi:hypothetical protein